jgi:hypothetical protein
VQADLLRIVQVRPLHCRDEVGWQPAWIANSSNHGESDYCQLRNGKTMLVASSLQMLPAILDSTQQFRHLRLVQRDIEISAITVQRH